MIRRLLSWRPAYTLSDQRFASVTVLAWSTLSLCLVALWMRGVLWPSLWNTQQWAIFSLRRLIHFTHLDLLLIVAVALAFLLAVMLLPDRRWVQRSIRVVMVGYATLHAAMLAINVTAIFWINEPLSYQMIQLADLGRTFTPQATIAAVADQRAILLLIGALATMGICVAVALVTYHRWANHRNLLLGYLAFGTICLIIAVVDIGKPPRKDPIRDAVTNPLVALVATTIAGRDNHLLTLPTSEPVDDYRIDRNAGPSLLQGTRPDRPNIILIVIESLAAGTFENADPAALPNLNGLARRGYYFDRAYVPIASSTRTNFALLTARYPLLSNKPETRSLAGRRFASLSRTLADRGYSTSFFMSGEFKFQSVDTFLADKGFGTLADIENIPCNTLHNQASRKFFYNKYVPDHCMIDAVSGWIKQQRQPYFTLIWANNTHFPFFPDNQDVVYPSRAARHMAALESTDRAIGTLLRNIALRGDAENTLIAVVGDHGEAFGEHNNVAHGSTVYDEDVRVPLIMAGPGISPGRISTLASMIDVSPSLLDLAGIDTDNDWQGRSVFSARPASRVFFFSTWKGTSVGYREGDMKTILDMRRNRVVRFDLARDPRELNPLPVSSTEADRTRRILAAWAQYNAGLYAPTGGGD